MFLVVTEIFVLTSFLVQWMQEKLPWKLFLMKILNSFIVCVFVYQQSFDLILLVSSKFRQSIHAADAGDLFINVNNLDLWSIKLNVSQRPKVCVCVCVRVLMMTMSVTAIFKISSTTTACFSFISYQSSPQDVTNVLFVENYKNIHHTLTHTLMHLHRTYCCENINKQNFSSIFPVLETMKYLLKFSSFSAVFLCSPFFS